ATRILHLAAFVTCWFSAIFSAFKFFIFLVLAAWCPDIPDCTGEVLGVAYGSRVYFARLVAALLLMAGFLASRYFIDSEYDAYTELRVAYKRQGQDYGTPTDVMARDNRTKALSDAGFVVTQFVLQLVAVAMLASVAESVVFPKAGLTISWLENPGSWGWIKNRYGAMHIMLFLEIIYLVGPQAAIMVCVVGYRSLGLAMLFGAATHALLVGAIIFAGLRLAAFSLMIKNCASWPECTTEIIGDASLSPLFIARFVAHGLLFLVYIIDEIYFITLQRSYRAMHAAYRNAVELAVIREIFGASGAIREIAAVDAMLQTPPPASSAQLSPPPPPGVPAPHAPSVPVKGRDNSDT
ncbi:MAG: hypothetical protein M0R22_10825, partial [Dehalococcoidia bacterium]|nr:hypothetical protein [Dehalococcoidia bacterium]